MPSIPLLDGNVNNSPHVVLLGAGASLAAFPNGDANGKQLPLMNNIVEVVGLSDLFDDEGINYKNINFEILYSNLKNNENGKNIVAVIEQTIQKYFSEMQIPKSPTLYDYLILSLRSKRLFGLLKSNSSDFLSVLPFFSSDSSLIF